MLIRLILSLCMLVLLPESVRSQDTPGSSTTSGAPASSPAKADILVPESEEERAEIEQAEVRQEAFKSLFVHGHYTFVPVPIFHYARNEGYWAGVSVPILESTKQDELRSITAPFYTHNRYVGETVGLYH